MRKMKGSGIEWIGEIPEGWEIKKLKYLTTLNLEKVSGENDLMYIGLEHIESNTGKIVNNYEPIYDFCGDTIRFNKNNILYGKLRPYLAKVILTDSDGKCSSEFFALKPTIVNSKYLFYLMLSKGFMGIVNSSTYGVKMPRAEWSFVGNLKLPIPREIEQQQIADYLDKKCAEIDSVISANEKTIEKLKEYRQSVIYEAVTGKIEI
ncbi:MAG: restriction endonuclease subunit S [Lutispora sp.]|nr:restriction endonuclease subunit S [Lutispora sp.]